MKNTFDSTTANSTHSKTIDSRNFTLMKFIDKISVFQHNLDYFLFKSPFVIIFSVVVLLAFLAAPKEAFIASIVYLAVKCLVTLMEGYRTRTVIRKQLENLQMMRESLNDLREINKELMTKI